MKKKANKRTGKKVHIRGKVPAKRKRRLRDAARASTWLGRLPRFIVGDSVPFSAPTTSTRTAGVALANHNTNKQANGPAKQSARRAQSTHRCALLDRPFD